MCWRPVQVFTTALLAQRQLIGSSNPWKKSVDVISSCHVMSPNLCWRTLDGETLTEWNSAVKCVFFVTLFVKGSTITQSYISKIGNLCPFVIFCCVSNNCLKNSHLECFVVESPLFFSCHKTFKCLSWVTSSDGGVVHTFLTSHVVWGEYIKPLLTVNSSVAIAEPCRRRGVCLDLSGGKNKKKNLVNIPKRYVAEV